jgi:hypothetical protein
LDDLKVIGENIRPLTKSERNIEIDSLTSVSEGYHLGDAFSPMSGWKAAAYRPENQELAAYYVEWREKTRQDKELNNELIGCILIHHRRYARTTEQDATLKIGQSWTSPKGDFTVTHTGPKVGIFSVDIRAPTNPTAEVVFHRKSMELKKLISLQPRIVRKKPAPQSVQRPQRTPRPCRKKRAACASNEHCCSKKCRRNRCK